MNWLSDVHYRVYFDGVHFIQLGEKSVWSKVSCLRKDNGDIVCP